jgi:glycosyltransferase involved in cell wall biosynthesis
VASGIFHPEAGGPATYLHEILPHLQARDWDVRLLTFGSGDNDYPYPVTRIPRRFLPLRYAHYAWNARREIAQADLIYAHTVDLPLVTQWRVRPHIPRMLKIVGDPTWERCIRKGWIAPNTDIDAFQQSNAQGVVAQQIASRNHQVTAMTHIIVPSDYLKQMVMGWGVPSERISVIYNALPSMRAMRGEARTQAQARQHLGLGDYPMLLTAARLTPWKGVDHLITALQDIPNVRLFVAGDGEELPRLREMAQALGERVVFLGRLARETLYEYMQASDYFVLYSGYEGLAHTLLESLRVGTPLIASAKGGNLEVVQDGVNGFLVPYVDVDAVRQTLKKAFSHEMRPRLSANTHLGMERFTFDYMVEATDRVLRGHLRSSSSVNSPRTPVL